MPRREKPLGTAHAAWAARGAIDGPFVLINADDYYGVGVFKRLAAHLRNETGWALAGYRLADTLTPRGGVNRAVCDIGPGGRLRDLREWRSVRRDGPALAGVGPDGTLAEIDPDTRVSMNAWALRPDVFPVLEQGLIEFVSRRPREQDEYDLPEAIASAVRTGARTVHVLEAGERWLGITYREDVDRVARALSGDER